ANSTECFSKSAGCAADEQGLRGASQEPSARSLNGLFRTCRFAKQSVRPPPPSMRGQYRVGRRVPGRQLLEQMRNRGLARSGATHVEGPGLVVAALLRQQ